MPQCGCGDGWVLADVRMLVCGLLIATALFMMSRSRDSKSNIAVENRDIRGCPHVTPAASRRREWANADDC